MTAGTRGGTGKTGHQAGFSKEIAKAIVDVVAKDAVSISRIKSDIGSNLPASWGISGSIRNWGLVLSGEDPSEANIAAQVCTGIAEATSDAISRAVKKGVLPDVSVATTISRVSDVIGLHHTATHVKTSEGGEAVFDWHATLSIREPMISKVANWRTSTGGTVYQHFKGF